jgi:hypothetical protein
MNDYTEPVGLDLAFSVEPQVGVTPSSSKSYGGASVPCAWERPRPPWKGGLLSLSVSR